MEECTAALASLTYAIKAQRALSEMGIEAKTVKLDRNQSSRGCEYGISYDCSLHPRVKEALRLSGIGARRYMRGGGEIV